MRSIWQRISAREDGFTLVELMTASALMLLVIGSIIGLFGGMQRFGARQAARSEATDVVRIAMDRMTKEIRQATQIRSTSTASTLDMDTYINGVETRIVYSGVLGGSLNRTEGGNTIPLAERLVTGQLFTYSTDPATGVQPSVVTINLSIRPEKFSIDDATIEVNSEVQLRNH